MGTVVRKVIFTFRYLACAPKNYSVQNQTCKSTALDASCVEDSSLRDVCPGRPEVLDPTDDGTTNRFSAGNYCPLLRRMQLVNLQSTRDDSREENTQLLSKTLVFFTA
jgi:hypothetical protein